jgi:hypothetical protein
MIVGTDVIKNLKKMLKRIREKMAVLSQITAFYADK